MNKYIALLILLLLFIIFFLAGSWYKHYKKSKLKDRIQNIFFEGKGHLEMIFYTTRRELNIKKEFDFSSKLEREYVEKILQCFKEDVLKNFWKDRLYLNCKLLSLSQQEYFILLLGNFLLENQFDKGFIFSSKFKINMYDEELVWFNENSYGAEYRYKLTDFSTAYYKMFLGCVLYNQNNKHLRKIISPVVNNAKIQELYDDLEKGEFEIYKR